MNQSPMDYSEALELVKLRIAEDNISWGTAVKEYSLLIQCSQSAALRDIGVHLKNYIKTLNKV